MSFRYTIETENPIVTDGNKMFNCKDGKLRLKIVEANSWHTGTPTEENCFYVLQCKGRIHPEPYYGVVVNGKFSAINYDGDLMPLPPDLVAWQKIEPYNASKERE